MSKCQKKASLNFSIDDNDIEWVASIMPGITFDDERKKVLKVMDSVDINAGPGSGKTTLLVAKLAILIKKWPYSNRGICVLSHTNVARNEIERKLGENSIGQRLLSYPHFVGTFQAFFDQFIVLPQLKSEGKTDILVDTDIVTNARWLRINGRDRIAFERHYGNPLQCELNALPDIVNIKANGKQSQFIPMIRDVVLSSISRGEYTYREMQLLAEKYVKENPHLCRLIAERFPLLLVDEAQDTNDFFWKLIDVMFPEDVSVKQYFGDSNQEIFSFAGGDNKNSVFPRKEPLKVTTSRRFTQSIAHMANSVAVDKTEMEGCLQPFSVGIKQTIFLFDPNLPEKVIPAFGHKILESFTDPEIHQYATEGCHIVGMIHRKTAGNIEKGVAPKSVADYYSNYDPSYGKEALSCLFDYFLRGSRNYKDTGEVSAFIKCVSDGIWRFLKKHANEKFLNLQLKQQTHYLSLCTLGGLSGDALSFPNYLIKLIESDWEQQEVWNTFTNSLIVYLSPWIDGVAAAKDDFIRWNGIISQEQGDEKEDEPNQIKALGKNRVLYIEDGREVNIDISSIHAVKGETHLATMILETSWYDYNMKSILKWLYGENGASGARNINRLKCQYVAMTRARGLICLAIPKNFVSVSDRTKLKNFGWDLVEL